MSKISLNSAILCRQGTGVGVSIKEGKVKG